MCAHIRLSACVYPRAQWDVHISRMARTSDLSIHTPTGTHRAFVKGVWRWLRVHANLGSSCWIVLRFVCPSVLEQKMNSKISLSLILDGSMDVCLVLKLSLYCVQLLLEASSFAHLKPAKLPSHYLSG